MSALIASPHWPFIWPVYALALATFVGLALWALLSLRAAARRAREDDAP